MAASNLHSTNLASVRSLPSKNRRTGARNLMYLMYELTALYLDILPAGHLGVLAIQVGQILSDPLDNVFRRHFEV